MIRPGLMVLVLLGFSSSALAVPAFLDKLKEQYKFSEDSTLGKAGCNICHVGGPPKRNVFGAQVEAALDASSTKQISAAILMEIASKDADGDGYSNEQELNEGTLPADAKSKPTSPPISPPNETAPSTTSAEGDESAKTELIPKHSFHPALSHFPLALFAIAALFEFLGRWKKNDTLRSASVLNLGAGLLIAIVTIATGIIAMLRLGYGLEGNMLIHLLLASTSVLLGLVAWTQRKKESPVYFITLLLCGGLVLIAGHFGGSMVFG